MGMTNETVDEKNLYEKRVRMCLLRWSGYAISEDEISYIIGKSNFQETLEKNPDLLGIPVTQTASTILFTAALDIKMPK